MPIRYRIRFPIRHQSTPILEIVDKLFLSGICMKSDGESERESDAKTYYEDGSLLKYPIRAVLVGQFVKSSVSSSSNPARLGPWVGIHQCLSGLLLRKWACATLVLSFLQILPCNPYSTYNCYSPNLCKCTLTAVRTSPFSK
jgi:hypothetical protein